MRTTGIELRGGVWDQILSTIREAVDSSVRVAVAYTIETAVEDTIDDAVAAGVAVGVDSTVKDAVKSTARICQGVPIRLTQNYGIADLIWETAWIAIENTASTPIMLDCLDSIDGIGWDAVEASIVNELIDVFEGNHEL